jgi:hypothetical protein
MLVSTQFIGKDEALNLYGFETNEQLNRAATGATMANNGETEKADKKSSS